MRFIIVLKTEQSVRTSSASQQQPLLKRSNGICPGSVLVDLLGPFGVIAFGLRERSGEKGGAEERVRKGVG